MASELNSDMLYEVMLKTDYFDLKALCRANKEAYKISESERFWEKKYIQDYGKPAYEVEEWKREYKMEYVKTHPEKIYHLKRRLDEYSNETVLTIKAKNVDDVYKFIAHYCNSDKYTYIASYLIDCDKKSEVSEPKQLNELCKTYKAKTNFFSTDLLKKAVQLYYFKPGYLYYAGCNKEEYLKFFKYLYQNGYCRDLVKAPMPDQIYRQYLTFEAVKTMLEISDDEDDEDTERMWLAEENYYEV